MNSKSLVLRNQMRVIFTFILLLTLLINSTGEVHAATLTVNTIADNESDGCAVNNCTLREAIDDANGGDTINFSVTGTITLISGQLTIDDDLAIAGPGSDQLSISGNNNDRVIEILNASHEVNISGLTIANGNTNDDGGGIYNQSTDTVTLLDIVFKSNTAADGGGMASKDSGKITLSNVTFDDNLADGGIGTSGHGGGLSTNDSDASLMEVIFISNTANGSSSGSGGGMHDTRGDTTLTNVTFSNNTSSGSTYASSGGLYLSSSDFTLVNVTFYNNTASGGASDRGGGIYMDESDLALTNITFSANTADIGGGLYTTSTDNHPVFNYVTMSGNTANNSGGGIYFSSEGSSSISLNSTILANNSAVNSGPDCIGTINTGSYNLVEDDSDCTLTTSNTITGSDPNLDSLQNNGGLTETHALLAGSPAIDKVPYGFYHCGILVADDQRGITRPSPTFGGCDIGAYEYLHIAEIDVQGNGNSIPDGDTVPDTTDNTDFGNVVVDGGLATHTFDIESLSPDPLVLTGSPRVEIGGTNPADFTLLDDPYSPIAGGSSTDFVIQFDPAAAGLRTATVSIENNDTDEDPYDFTIQGTGTAPSMLTAPLIAPTDGSVVLSSPMQVAFNQPVLNDTSTGSVTNIDNYLLVEAGPNGVINTVSCFAKPGGDDQKITITSVNYNSVRYVATINTDTLDPGSYRLFVCGTTSVEGLYGNELNGGLADSISSFSVVTAASTGGGSGSGGSAILLPATGFARDHITPLPPQPDQAEYAPLGDLWLEIPSLGIRKSIIGVPQSSTGWDLTWLGSEIGYLNGTAFPTWSGNTALTGHVYDPNGLPGPFVNLGRLIWGKKVYIHAWGSLYTYEVRSISWWTKPEDLGAISEHEDYDWITLITCRGYDEKTDSYKYRTVVRAVLVDMK